MFNVFLIVLYLSVQTIVNGAQSTHLMFFNETKTWSEANKVCNDCGGKLVEWNENTSKAISNSNIQNTVVWIGNYRIENHWIVEKGCVTEMALQDTGIPYNEILYNNTEFCRRRCNDEQVLAIKGNRCYCVDSNKVPTDVGCNGETGDYAKLFAVDDVYACDFEQPCTNITFGQESSGLVWNKTRDIGNRQIGKIGREKGLYLLLQYLTQLTKAKARVLIRLNLPKRYFCLSFKYYMYFDASIEIFVSEENGRKYLAWKKYGHEGRMWYSSSFDIKGHPSLMIEFLGAMENNNMYARTSVVAIDDIKVKSVSCNKEERLNCNFDDSSCEWKPLPSFKLAHYKGDFYLKTERNSGIIISPDVNPFLSKEFCLKFQYRIQRGEILVNANTDKIKLLTENDKWEYESSSFTVNQIYNIIFDTPKESTIGIDNISLRLGSCEEATSKQMCPVINLGDNARLSVDFCSKIMDQKFICQFEDRQMLAKCKSGIEIIRQNNESDSELNTTVTEEMSINEFSTISYTSSDENTVSRTDQTVDNNNSTILPSVSNAARTSSLETGFAVVTSILVVVVILLVLLTIFMCIKTRRYQENVKEKENLNRIASIQNHGYEMEAVNTGNIQIQTSNDTDYELASSVKTKTNHPTGDNVFSNDTVQNKHESDYQNCDNFTPDQKHDSQIYQDMEEGAYDQLGKSADRRKITNNEADNLYDHGQPVKSQNNGIYDTTKTKTGDGYFVLEPERGSAIYDHTK